MRIFTSYKYVFLLIGLALVTHLQWFNPFSILSFGDWSHWPDEATMQLFDSWGAWISFFNFGAVNIQIGFNFFTEIWSLFAHLGLSYDLATKVTFLIPIAILGFISPYILFKKLTRDELISFVVALFYGTTTYFLIQSGEPPIVFVYALAPLLIYLFISALEKNNTTDWLVFVLVYWVSSCYEIRITYIVTFIFFFYFIYFHIFDISKFWRRMLLSGVVFLGLNIFWLLPTVFGGLTGAISAVAGRGLFGNSLFDIRNAFALFQSAWTGGYPNRNFVSQPILSYFWLIPIIAFSFLLLNGNIYKRKIIFWGIISLLGVFLTKQAAEPLTGAYLWLYNNFPGFNLFREASKFYLLTAIGYAGLLSYGLLILKKHKNENVHKNKYIFPTLLILIASTSIWNTKPLITEEIGTMFLSRHVPQDYVTLNDYILKQSEYFRTLWVPHNSEWGIYTNSHPRFGDVDALQSSWVNLNQLPSVTPQQNQIIGILQQPFSSTLLNISSMKYVIVPTEDIANDNDFFKDYGGEANPNIRQWYIDQLDALPWLKRVDIGTTDLVVYENPTYQQPIHSFTQLYALDSTKSLDRSYNFITNELHGDFNFVSRDMSGAADLSAAVQITKPFEVSGNINSVGGVITATSTVTQGAVNTLYTDPSADDVFADIEAGHVVLYRNTYDATTINGSQVTSGVFNARAVLASVEATSSSTYYLSVNGAIIELKGAAPVRLGELDVGATIKLYSAGDSVVFNGSFEFGPWQQAVGDCNNYDANALLGMSLSTSQKSDGIQSLELDATRHVACTSQVVLLQGGEYLFSLDYQGQPSTQAGYYLGFNDAAGSTLSARIPIVSDQWQPYLREVSVPDGATSANIFLYAYATDGKTKVATRYDNVQMRPLSLVQGVSLAKPDPVTAAPLLAQGGSTSWQYSDFNYHLENLISNPSFENGLWGATVGDCNNYDDNGIIGMKLSSSTSNGRQSLELDATRHAACTGAAVRVVGGREYALSFDYQVGPDTKEASYYVGYDSTTTDAISETLVAPGKQWTHFSRVIRAPSTATSLSLSFYARETDGTTNNIDRYDNVSLIEVPDVANKYYVVSDPGLKLKNPASATFDLLNPTKKLVHIKGATTPFYLAFSESYHPQWKLELANAKSAAGLASWWPGAKPDSVPEAYHYDLDDFLNGWYVDPAALCRTPSGLKEGCTVNADGSYDIEMVIEFWPQRWFYLGLIISGTTLLSCIGYLGYVGVRAMRKKKYGRI